MTSPGVPPAGMRVIPTDEWDKISELIELQAHLLRAEVWIEGPVIHELKSRTYVTTAQEAWENRVVARLIIPGLGGLRCLAAGSPLPSMSEESQFIIGSAYVGFAAFLDEQLEDYVAANGLKCKEDLNGRIHAVSQTVSHAAELHAIRKLRNRLAHDPVPPAVEWEDVEGAIAEIEKALCELGVLIPAPEYQMVNAYRNALVKTPGEGFGHYDMGITLRMDGEEYRKYEWKLKYGSLDEVVE